MTVSILCSLLIAATVSGTADFGDQLLQQYQLVRTSINNQRGLAVGDIDTIRTLRDEMSDWNEVHDDSRLVASELQLSMWLDETERCNALFQRLSTLEPDNTDIVVAWADFMLLLPEAIPEVIFGDLIKQYPNTTGIVLGWVRWLDKQNRFDEGIATIERLDATAIAEPKVAELYASLLFANNRFQDSVQVLENIDRELLIADPALSTKIGSSLSANRRVQSLWEEEEVIREVEEAADDLPRAHILTSRGPVSIELFEDHAPNTVANFISLAESGYYDGIRFHRVLPKFMVQSGDPNSRVGDEGKTGEGGPGYTIKDEHKNDDYRNHFAGSLSMANTGAPNSGGSQFFLTHLPTPHLNGRHTVFGRVTAGLDIVRSIEQDDVIITITITRKRDRDYTPETISSEVETATSKKPTLSKDSQSKE